MQRDHPEAGHYEWFSGFLDARGATLTVRLFVAATALSMAAALLILLAGAGGPQSDPARAMMWLAVLGGVAGGALWLWRWPSRVQSSAFAATTAASITLACLAYPDPLASLLGCIAFTTIGAYVAFFHSTRLVLAFVFVAVAVALSQAIELAAQGRLALGAVDFFLVVQANIAMPVAIHSLLRALRGDLVDADLDPLTGLLNRRAFRRQMTSLLARRYDSDRYLLVALVDLDNFKALNDAHGHLAGDQALVSVADALRATATPTAVITRSGGEEFLIADVAPSPRAMLRYQDVCDAIAALPAKVTASVGTAFAELHGESARSNDAIDHLIAAADMAMYRAKRNGGNQCHHHGVWPSPGSTS
ncbi:diguanylate cyclase (GGDEF)-like protein [Mycolicibacterium iranicum]|uniref:Diguanylate cyclase (GGDEF)-like protein n=1 Tax=Mycolicibacterium iranicum TaxID=912594 RepID=A0A839Q409_MYCIR|nr:GGDEF domain-containing protein [Mycolicibacterium iranicum]MBB2990998.1 diguanylate cyclase (GGDEF)-like protein [Mycolicibacterium iranicum]